jgi:hypothetical protein
MTHRCKACVPGVACLVLAYAVPALAAPPPQPSANGATSLEWIAARVDPGNDIIGVSCPSVSLCVAVDERGNVVTSTKPAGGPAAWKVARVDAGRKLWGVSCPSTTLCVAVDGLGNIVTSTDPTGGAAAWRVARAGAGDRLTGVSCPSMSLCVAVSDAGCAIATSTDPTGGAGAWSASAVCPLAPFDISCPSVSFCVAVDGDGHVIASTDPTGGASAWAAADLGDVRLNAVSCLSASWCVAGDVFGNVLTATDPAGGGGGWSAPSPVTDSTLWGVTCLSTVWCIAADGAGNVISSTNPAGGAGAWRRKHVSRSGFGDIACPSAELCVAASFGYVLVGAPKGVGAPPARGRISLASRVVRGGAGRGIALRCRGAGPCRGRYSIRTAEPKPVLLALGSYSLAPDTTRSVSLTLGGNGIARLRRHEGHLRARLTLKPHHGKPIRRSIRLTLVDTPT